MSTAQRVFVIYGLVSLVYGMLLGLSLSSVRFTSPVASRHLVTAHLSALIQSSMHLGLGFAAGFATVTPWVLTAAASAMATGSALFVGGATANWLMRIGDHFAVRSPGWYLLSVSGPLHIGGALTVLIVVSSSLLGST